MNKELKFRGKRLDTKEWVYGYGVIFGEHYDNKTDSERKASIFVEYDNRSGLNFQMVEVDPDTVGQYTGLQDSKGADIYKGDILRCLSFWGGQRPPAQKPKYPVYGEVKYGDFGHPTCHTAYGFYIDGKQDEIYGWQEPSIKDTESAEVVGNVHDNPELKEG